MNIYINDKDFELILEKALAFIALRDSGFLDFNDYNNIIEESEQYLVENYFGIEKSYNKTIKDIINDIIKNLKGVEISEPLSKWASYAERK